LGYVVPDMHAKENYPVLGFQSNPRLAERNQLRSDAVRFAATFGSRTRVHEAFAPS